MRIQFTKNLDKHFPKETLESVLDVEQYLTDALSQELQCMGMMKLSGEITFKLAAKGWASEINFVLK